MCAGHQPGDAVCVQHAARGPQVLPCSVGQIPSCHTDAVQADVGHVVDHGHRRVVSGLGFPGVDHGEGAAGDDANAAECTTEDVRAVVAERIGRPVGHAVVHRQALVDVQSSSRVHLPTADSEVGGGIQIRAQIHEFEVLAGPFVPVASTRNVVRTASVPQDGPGLGADRKFCRTADVRHLDAKHVVAWQGASRAVSVSVEQRLEEFSTRKVNADHAVAVQAVVQHALVLYDWGVEGLVDAGAAPRGLPCRAAVQIEPEQASFAGEVGGAVVNRHFARGVRGDVTGRAAFPWRVAVGQVRQIPDADASVFVRHHDVPFVDSKADDGVPARVSRVLLKAPRRTVDMSQTVFFGGHPEGVGRGDHRRWHPNDFRGTGPAALR